MAERDDDRAPDHLVLIEGVGDGVLYGQASSDEAAHVFGEMIGADAHKIHPESGGRSNETGRSFGVNWDSGRKTVWQERREEREAERKRKLH